MSSLTDIELLALRDWYQLQSKKPQSGFRPYGYDHRAAHTVTALQELIDMRAAARALRPKVREPV